MTQIPEGIYFDLSDQEYREAEGISQSELKLFGEAATPLHYISTPKKEPTKDMEFGTLVHSAVLKPKSFPSSYHLQPETYPAKVKGETVQKKWNYGADYCNEWLASHSDRQVVTNDELERAAKIRESLLKLEEFSSALAMGKTEVSFFRKDKETGLMLKCRVDLIVTDDSNHTWLFDLKKVQSGCATIDEFSKSCWNYGYDIQAASYLEITGASKFVFVPFDDKEPFDCCQFEASQSMIATGYRRWRNLLDRYAICVRENKWPGYFRGIGTISLPGFVKE